MKCESLQPDMLPTRVRHALVRGPRETIMPYSPETGFSTLPRSAAGRASLSPGEG